MRAFIESVETEYRRYKTMADQALAQVRDDEFFATDSDASNSLAVIVRHVGGNLLSRFTDFLASDGEKPWRQRDNEFEQEGRTRVELLEEWERGWGMLFSTLAALADADLSRSITIRKEPLPVHAALHRSLAHTASHVGQIVYVAKALRGADWSTLSIPRGKSQEFNKAMER